MVNLRELPISAC